MASCERHLLDLLVQLFTAQELRYFLLELDDGSLLAALPGTGATEQDVHFQALLTLQRRGLIDDGFFDLLRKARERRSDEIDAAQRQWQARRLAAPDAASAAPAPARPAIGATWGPPLVVVIVWHERNAEGARSARLLHDRWSRNPQTPLEPGLGIPVFFCTHPGDEGELAVASLERAERVAVVVLVDREMVADEAWAGWASALARRSAQRPGWRIHPVTASREGLRLAPELRGREFLRLYDEPEAHRDSVLSLWLTHELSRQLRDQPRIVDGMFETEATSAERLVLLLSRADESGDTLSTSLMRLVEDETPLHAFTELRDLGQHPDPQSWKDLGRSVLVAVHGDAAGSRVACQDALLRAKRARRPVVVVDRRQRGEARSFPYLGNVPTVRLKEADVVDLLLVMETVLLEVLRHEHAEHHLNSLRSSGWLPSTAQLCHGPPELMSFVDEPADHTLIVYPDPPIARVERELLAAAGRDVRTPASFATIRSGLRVAVSISESEEPSPGAPGSVHLQDALVELSRYLLNAGATLAYGGDLRAGGFSLLFRDLAAAHGQRLREDEVEARRPHLRWYLAWPYHLALNAEEERALRPDVRVRRVTPYGLEPGEVSINDASRAGAQAAALTLMREEMADDTDARLLLGGRTQGWKGSMPGVLEEALLTLRSRKPLYLIGAFGGCTAAIIEGLQGARPAAFADLDAGLIDELARHGVAGLRNGLSLEENRRLFTTPYLAEIVGLVLRGLGELG